MTVSFCRSCGRLVSRNFAYCPYCGVGLRPGPDAAEACSSFSRLEEMQANSREALIMALLDELDGIEADVEKLLGDRVSACDS
ncbi:MAG: hypothetical protein CVV47_09690 [Spirochaetae bacterium HGW-Spirochaetae-3]|jgi:hypothetical protein|nr:MAG: hypothetical protein CVV47_09690 [Spirochaetae bacterium HGW-Spirochaetae-3]